MKILVFEKPLMLIEISGHLKTIADMDRIYMEVVYTNDPEEAERLLPEMDVLIADVGGRGVHLVHKALHKLNVLVAATCGSFKPYAAEMVESPILWLIQKSGGSTGSNADRQFKKLRAAMCSFYKEPVALCE